MKENFVRGVDEFDTDAGEDDGAEKDDGAGRGNEAGGGDEGAGQREPTIEEEVVWPEERPQTEDRSQPGSHGQKAPLLPEIAVRKLSSLRKFVFPGNIGNMPFSVFMQSEHTWEFTENNGNSWKDVNTAIQAINNVGTRCQAIRTKCLTNVKAIAERMEYGNETFELNLPALPPVGRDAFPIPRGTLERWRADIDPTQLGHIVDMLTAAAAKFDTITDGSRIALEPQNATQKAVLEESEIDINVLFGAMRLVPPQPFWEIPRTMPIEKFQESIAALTVQHLPVEEYKANAEAEIKAETVGDEDETDTDENEDVEAMDVDMEIEKFFKTEKID